MMMTMMVMMMIIIMAASPSTAVRAGPSRAALAHRPEIDPALVGKQQEQEQQVTSGRPERTDKFLSPPTII